MIAGTFVVLAVSAVVAGVIDFARPMDEAAQSSGPPFTTLAIWAVAMGFVTYKTFTGRLFAGHRWVQIDRQLAAEGFLQATEREVQDTVGIPVLLLSPRLLRTDRSGGIDHVAIGRVGGREVRTFRVRIRGAGPGRSFDVPAVAVRVPAHLARTVIRPARHGLRPPIQMKRVTFELERFNRSIEVRSVDRFFATAILDPRMMEWLERHLGRAVIELNDGWVVAWSNALRGAPVSPLELIEVLAAFSEHIPRSVPSFFPQRGGSVRWSRRRKRVMSSGWLDRLTNVADVPGDHDRHPPSTSSSERERRP